MKIEEVLEQEDKYLGRTFGISMLPMLKSGRDVIVVYPKQNRLKVLDVTLYKRGEQYVLHRVIKVTDDGYLIRGDNCYGDEYVKEEQVLGVMVGFFRKGVYTECSDDRMIRYARRRVKTYPIRRFIHRIKQALKRFIKR